MQKFEVFDQHFWQPLKTFGLTHSFWNLNSHTIIYTWVVLTVLFIACLLASYLITNKKDSVLSYLILSFVKTFDNLIGQSLPTFSFNHFAFITSLFSYIFLNNIISLLPFIEEPTADANTTIALGLCSFLYVQYSSIKENGIKEYVKEYFAPFFLLFPLNVIGELAKIISISFRLFGNIFGGAVISKLWSTAISGSIIAQLFGILSGVNIIIVLFFVLFEGFIQAFVFSMLTLTYLSIAVSHENAQHMEAIT